MKTDAGTQSSDISRALESWYVQHSGDELCASVRARLQPILDLAFGYHILQLGPLSHRNLIAGSPINHHLIASDSDSVIASDSGPGQPSLLCHGDELPLESESVDMLVAVHALEFSDHPHASLREMQRVLRSRGHLVILGFNPWSLSGVGRYLRSFSRESLWARHHPVSLRRLTDWLHLVDCELDSAQHLYPLLLTGQGRVRRMIESVDAWAMRRQIPFGSLYLAHAIKQIPGARRPRLVPVRQKAPIPGLAVPGRPTPAPRREGSKGRDLAA